MAKFKPPQPNPIHSLPFHSPAAAGPNNPSNSSESTQEPDQDFTSGFAWSGAEATNAAYARLDNTLRDFVYGISRGYSIRHACRMSGEDYERMLDYLNNRSSLYKPDLLKLVDKARAVAYARNIEKLNAATDWHAAAFWLERRERKEFAPVRLQSEELEETSARRALIRMSPETLDALSQAYDAEHGTPNNPNNNS